MQRRKFSQEFKTKAVKLVTERGVSVTQAARDLDVHESVLGRWIKAYAADPQHAFPGHGQMRPEQLEIDRLRREVAKLRAERDILKKAAAYRTRDQARADVFDYIERFYNLRRRHSTLGYLSPVEYENQAVPA